MDKAIVSFWINEGKKKSMVDIKIDGLSFVVFKDGEQIDNYIDNVKIYLSKKMSKIDIRSEWNE